MRTKEYRNSDKFLRNEFESRGVWGFSLIKKQEIDLNTVELIACSDTSRHDTQNLNKGVHFFTDDYRFESLYMHPERTLDKYSKYRFLLTPDYSLYTRAADLQTKGLMTNMIWFYFKTNPQKLYF